MKKGIFKTKLDKLKQWTVSNKKQAGIVYSLIAIALVIVILVVVISGKSSQTDTVYKEETVSYGELTVGITESGSIEIGTSTQTMDVDISAYSGNDEFSWNSMGGGGMGGGNNTDSTSSSDSDDDSRILEVESVYVTVGQEIAEGDAIAKLSEDSVTSIRAELEADVVDAQNTYDQTVAEQALTDQSAESTYSLNSL